MVNEILDIVEQNYSDELVKLKEAFANRDWFLQNFKTAYAFGAILVRIIFNNHNNTLITDKIFLYISS